jgi:hypothetical protein
MRFDIKALRPFTNQELKNLYIDLALDAVLRQHCKDEAYWLQKARNLTK